MPKSVSCSLTLNFNKNQRNRTDLEALRSKYLKRSCFTCLCKRKLSHCAISGGLSSAGITLLYNQLQDNIILNCEKFTNLEISTFLLLKIANFKTTCMCNLFLQLINLFYEN